MDLAAAIAPGFDAKAIRRSTHVDIGEEDVVRAVDCFAAHRDAVPAAECGAVHLDVLGRRLRHRVSVGILVLRRQPRLDRNLVVSVRDIDIHDRHDIGRDNVDAVGIGRVRRCSDRDAVDHRIGDVAQPKVPHRRILQVNALHRDVGRVPEFHQPRVRQAIAARRKGNGRVWERRRPRQIPPALGAHAGRRHTALTIDRAIADDAHIGCVHRQDHR